MAETALQTYDIPQRASKADSPIRIDWAACHSESQNTSDEIVSTTRNVFRTPPPKDSAKVDKEIKELHTVHNGSIVSADKNVYDIPTLLKYRGSLAGIAVFAKINTDALAENLFQYIGFNQSLRLPARSRALSELSHISRGGAGSHGLTYPTSQMKVAGQPQRQPLAPPENSMIQQHEGFVRFLKQHASPPHHRVTAGGRIVPAGPLSPPPMFDYASLTGMVRARSGKSQESTSRGALGRNELKPHDATIQTQASMAFPDHFSQLRGLHAPVSFNQGFNSNFPGSNDPGSQLSMSLIPVGTFEDGTTMALYKGSYHRTYWNGTGTVIEPLHGSKGQVSIGTQTELDRSVPPHDLHRSFEFASSQERGQRLPLTNTTNRSRVSSSQSQVSSRVKSKETQQLELNLTLRNLDKHLALHHYDLSQEERASFITQRKSLVEEIDKIRRIKEPSSQDLPVVDSMDGARRATGRSQLFPSGPQSNPAMKDGKLTSLNVLKNGKVSKPLSPAALPFIPSGMQVPTTEPKDSPGVLPQIASSMQASNGVVRSVDLPTHSQINHDARIDHFHQQDESLDRDPIDPAMRTIHNSDITYAARYIPDRPGGGKKYCTTVSEFQEAIRQVRQQARLYGCAGGSSKDPAYDAEQDIWWAICDQDPIPIPPNVPDHVSSPRPWDWSDSVFNYRCTVVPLTKVGLPLRSSAVSSTCLQRVTQNVDKDIDTAREISSLTRKLTSTPLQDVSYSSDSNRLNAEMMRKAVPKTTSESLDKEYLAVQNAIDALNRRSKAIMQQANNFSVMDLHELNERKVDSGTSRFQLASLSYAQEALYRRASNVHIANTLQADRNGLNVQANQTRASSGQGKRLASVSLEARDPVASQTPKQSNRQVPTSDQSTLIPSQSDVSERLDAAVKRASDNNALAPIAIVPVQTLSSLLPQTRKVGDITNSEGGLSRTTYSNAEIQSSVKSSTNGVQRDLFSRTRQQLSPRKAARKAKELYERSKSRLPQRKQEQNTIFSTQPGPRVNLPIYTSSQMRERSDSLQASADSRAPQPAFTQFNSNEVKAITVTCPSSDTFLRDMLKGPRYSSSQPVSKRTQTKRLSKPHMNTVFKDGSTTMEAKKENTSVQRYDSAVLKDSHSNLNRLAINDHDGLLAGKAASSLASSAYHASGYLPQYDGAGKAHTSTVHQQHGVPISHRQAKVNLPHRSSYDEHPSLGGTRNGRASFDSNSSYDKRSHWTATPFGLDGSGESPSKNEGPTGAPKDKGKGKQKEFDTMGVTRADFDQQRADPNNAWHHGQVTDLFNEIAEEENAYMITRMRQNTKTE